MSKIALTPNASGTGTFTLASPNSNTNRTITLPDAAGELLTSDSSLSSGKLTGALPAIGGSNLTSLTSSSLSGALPAIDGSALTGIVTGRTYATPANTTSGTAFDFTGIPAGVKEVEVLFDEVRVTGGNGVYVQLGTASGVVTSGYQMNSSQIFGSSVNSNNTFTGGVLIRQATRSGYGSVKLLRSNSSSNSWLPIVHIEAMNAVAAQSLAVFGGGGVDLSAELTQVRIQVESGGNFDTGKSTIAWSY